MRKLIHYLAFFLILLIATAAKPQVPVEGPVFVVNKEMPNYTFSDQFGEAHTMDTKVERLFVALDKEAAHAVNDFLANQKPNYLADRNASLLVDISAAPGIIQKLFILPGLKKFEYPVLIFRDEQEAAPFRMGVDPEKLLEVKLQNTKIIGLSEYEANAAGVKAMMKEE